MWKFQKLNHGCGLRGCFIWTGKGIIVEKNNLLDLAGPPNNSTSVFLCVFLYVHYLVSGRCPLWLGDGSRIIVLVNYVPYIYIYIYIPVESFETPICSRRCPYISIWLVVWNMNFMTFHSVGNVIIPTDELTPSFFRGVAKNHQPDYPCNP